jgi:putative transposase
MTTQPLHRHSIRLQGYDYSTEGAYFVTIVTQKRECLFGKIVTGDVWLNDAGQMVQKWWFELAHKFPKINVEPFIVMPNHIHGIIVINPGDCAGDDPSAPLSEIVQWYKTMTTNDYIRQVKQNHWPPFPGRLWQRNYYEHIIRDETEWGQIDSYIKHNPMQWEMDDENPITRAS